MQIVIDIPKEQYSLIMQSHRNGVTRFIDKEVMMYAIKNGTVLPKGHGRLIDADMLCDYFWDNRSKLYTHKDLRIVIDNTSTIIEADKEN